MTPRAELVAHARDVTARGSQSFAAASRLFAPRMREHAWLLYAWCRAADDLTDGQVLGHGAAAAAPPAGETQAQLERLTAAALDGDEPVPPPFAALRLVAREAGLPRRFIDDHLAGFALDAAGWRPRTGDDLLRYCYHVAGAVGCMMAIIAGVAPSDDDTLDRACDLGIAFQLANIVRDVVPDAEARRCYLPADWLARAGICEADIADPARRPEIAEMARPLVTMARTYRRSARVGAARLPFRARLAVLAADGIYGAIGEAVAARGTRAWDQRVRTSSAAKAGFIVSALGLSLAGAGYFARDGLWTRPRQA